MKLLKIILSLSLTLSLSHYSAPTLTTLMQPEAGTALDIQPFNTFTLRCLARAPDGVLLQKTFEWRTGGNTLTDDGSTTLISHRNTSMPQSVSELTVSDLSRGSHTYFCSVSMSVPGGVNLVTHASGLVTVKGMCELCILSK